jgi:DNA-binding beta-propeller fold protein YncE
VIRRRSSWIFLLLAALSLSASSRGDPQPPLRLTQKIPLPDVEGRIDHFAFAAGNNRLFVCALGNNSVEVVDLTAGRRIHSITGLGAPQGIAFVPEFNRLFVANDKGGVVRMYDAQSFQRLRELSLNDDADNIRYDPAARQILVGFGKGGIATVDAADGKQTGSIELSGHPEAFELEPNGARLFVNVPDLRHIAVIDRRTNKVTATWKTNWATANYPMALDQPNHRLFIGCRFPSRLLVLNTDSGEIVARLGIDRDADEIFYDSKRRRIYVVCGAGKIDLISQKDANRYEGLTTVDTAAGARTGLFVPQLDTLFVAVPHDGGQQAEIRGYHIN